MDTISHYSVPITRRVGSAESEIPPEYRGRTHMSWQEHVRCGLFAGDNLVQVTWNGPDEATLRNMQANGPAVTIVGTVPGAGGGAYPHIPCPSHQRPGLRLGHIQHDRIRGGHRPGRHHRHRAGSHQHLKAVA